MSEIAEKPLITRVAPLERIYYCASRAEGLKPDRHEIRMQSQFLLLGVIWLPPALAMAELERLLKGYDADHSRLLENVLETAHQQFLKFCEPQKREGGGVESHVECPRQDDALQCLRFMSTRYALAVELCAAYVCSRYGR